MEIYTDNWFKYVRENVLAEGLRDIGLPEFVIDYLEDAMPDASEKACEAATPMPAPKTPGSARSSADFSGDGIDIKGVRHV